MPINPITLDKIDINTIRQIETKIIDRIIHHTNEAQANKKNNNNQFDLNKQNRAIEEFAKFLAKYNLRSEAKTEKNKVKLKILNKNGDVLIESHIDDIDYLLRTLQDQTGNLIDLRG
ncbi:MAG: hypothetical protein JG776_793 [Caloramator sp.]|jgi:hypothetical protein|uniref:hypothetical protein n=1 Tax=Caloramator sp. TaxID=1871330 RepID=UPI001D3BA51F|nr:hypothetical protein [Caloramator sp.]MBZ4663101.1 hypothetical protein [Caloramator sp.]